ncbi:hypothetical protein [Psychromonas hadalis]|uniref:hypothetical protein n=1 Tax=Psychromonas hadalis TaxID=211669 RepID=UPI0003B7B449|nr:hypothetical protein [Psychromonas hadalis]
MISPRLAFFICSFILTLSPHAPLFANHQQRCISHSEQTTIIDKTYHYLNSSFCQPALWFDDFFVDERISEDSQAGTMVRWYNDFSLDEDKNFRYKTKLTARVHLPKVTHKLKLVFESDAEDAVINLFPNKNEPAENSLGLRYDWVVKEQQSLNVKVTIKPSIEMRYRYTIPLSEYFISRITQKIYQKKKLTGSATLLDFDVAISENFLFRWTNFVKIETKDRLELGSGFTLYQFISTTQAFSYKTSVTAQEKPNHYISNYHLSLNYRQNIFRKWFYYELTPELNWNKEQTTPRESEASLTLRLEVLFNNI